MPQVLSSDLYQIYQIHQIQQKSPSIEKSNSCLQFSIWYPIPRWKISISTPPLLLDVLSSGSALPGLAAWSSGNDWPGPLLGHILACSYSSARFCVSRSFDPWLHRFFRPGASYKITFKYGFLHALPEELWVPWFVLGTAILSSASLKGSLLQKDEILEGRGWGDPPCTSWRSVGV